MASSVASRIIGVYVFVELVGNQGLRRLTRLVCVCVWGVRVCLCGVGGGGRDGGRGKGREGLTTSSGMLGSGKSAETDAPLVLPQLCHSGVIASAIQEYGQTPRHFSLEQERSRCRRMKES